MWCICVEIRHSQERGIVVRKGENEERGLKEKNSEGKCVCVRACLCVCMFTFAHKLVVFLCVCLHLLINCGSLCLNFDITGCFTRT